MPRFFIIIIIAIIKQGRKAQGDTAMKLSEFKKWAAESGIRITRKNIMGAYLVYLNEVIARS